MFLRKNDKLEALLGAKSEFKGDISTQGTLRIDGNFAGGITADWVIIGEGGSSSGDIIARGVIIGGKVEGNIRAQEIVDIKHTGQLFGDVYTKKLSIAEGSIFEGHSHILRDESKVIDFPNKEASAK